MPINLHLTIPTVEAEKITTQDVFEAVQNLSVWDFHCLQWVDIILTHWIVNSLMDPNDQELKRELLGLIMRIQTVKLVKNQSTFIQKSVDAFYHRWDGMANVLALYIERQKDLNGK